MKFTVNRSLLKEQLAILKSVIETNSPLKLLTFIHFKADDRLRLRIVTSESQLTLDVEAEITDPGEVLLPGELITEVVGTYAGDDITFSYGKSLSKELALTCGRNTTHFAMVPVEDFVPAWVVEEKYDRRIPAGDLKRAIDFVSFAAATRNDNREALRCMSFKINKGIMELACADGYRLSRSRAAIVEEDLFEDIAAVLDNRAMVDLCRVISGRTDDIEISVHGGESCNVGFRAPGFEFVVRKVQVTYIDYEKYSSSEYNSSVTLKAKTLAGIAKTVRTMAMGDSYIPVIKLFSGDGVLQLKTKDTEEDKSASATVEAVCDGEEFSIALNGNYLLAGLKAIEKHCEEADKLIIRRSKMRPAVLELEGQDSFFYVIMPVDMNDK